MTHIELTCQQALDHLRVRCTDQRLGFVTVASTSWHALGIRAWIDSLRRQGDDRQGIIVWMSGAQDATTIAAPDFSLSTGDGSLEVLRVSPSRGRLLSMLLGQLLHSSRSNELKKQSPLSTASNSPFYVALPLNSFSVTPANVFTLSFLMQQSVALQSRVKLVTVDEGLSSYLCSQSFREPLPRFHSRRLTQRARIRFHQFYQRKTCAYGDLDRLLFSRPRGKGPLQVKRDIAAEYHDVLERKTIDRFTLPPDRPVALFLPQPWQRHHVDPQTDIRLRRRVFARLAAAGYQVIIKPHPRDTSNNYLNLIGGTSAELLISSDPVEYSFRLMRPNDIVMGYNSTSLLTARTLYGLDSYSLGDALIESGPTSPWFQTFQAEFRRLSSGLVEGANPLFEAA